MPAIFLDKDGTLIENVHHNITPSRISLTWRAGEALQVFKQLGYRLIVITNQPGIAKGLFTEDALILVERRLNELLAQYSVTLDGFYYCPHSPDGSVPRYAMACECRKPLPGLLQRAAAEHSINLTHSWMIGDILNDVEAGRRAGCRTVLIDNGNETEWVPGPLRTPDLTAPDLYEAASLIAVQSRQRAPGRAH